MYKIVNNGSKFVERKDLEIIEKCGNMEKRDISCSILAKKGREYVKNRYGRKDGKEDEGDCFFVEKLQRVI